MNADSSKIRDQSRQLRMTVYVALFAALIAAGAYIAIPIGPVPVVLQNFFIMLAALLLGRRWGAACVGIYLLAGAIGLPVFASGTGGIGRIMGPTGGYLLSYLPAAWIIGLLSERGGGRMLPDLLALLCGALVVYAGGTAWLKMLSGLSWPKAISAGMFVFLPGDAVKIAAALPVARTLRPVIAGTLLDTVDTREHH
ncbi:MAG: biotin transporter BioY [Desulfosalsimonadaceae bacterium]